MFADIAGKGFFACLYNGSASGKVETRALHDFFYIGMAVCGWPEQRAECRIPKRVRDEMVAWSQAECMTADWMRPSRAKSALRSLRRALLMPRVNPGSLYRCGKRP